MSRIDWDADRSGHCPGWENKRVGIKVIEAQTGGRHFIEKWRFEIGMAIVAHFFPAVIIAHQENDVWPGWSFSAWLGAIKAGQEEKDEGEQLFHVIRCLYADDEGDISCFGSLE